MKSLPEVFIGSSTEGLAYAESIQDHLENVADSYIWNQDIFKPSNYFLESLEKQIRKTDFAIFIYSPDDELISRSVSYKVARDNIIFEIGFFIGALGRERVFIIRPEAPKDLKLPTDFEGIVYEKFRKRDNVHASLGPCSRRIKSLIKEMGVRKKIVSNIISNFPPEPESVSILEVTYTVRILSDEGDAYLKRETRILPKITSINKKRHSVFSHSSSTTLKKFDLKAWDERGNNLITEIERDLDNRKEFIIRFKDSIKPENQFIYFYSCKWEGIFPENSSYIILKSDSHKLNFNLELANNLEFKFIEASEIKTDGNKRLLTISQKDEPIAQKQGFILYKFELEEYNKDLLEVEIRWKWGKKSNRITVSN